MNHLHGSTENASTGSSSTDSDSITNGSLHPAPRPVLRYILTPVAKALWTGIAGFLLAFLAVPVQAQQFGEKQVISSTNASGGAVARAADFDEDGDNDVIAAFTVEGKIIWFENDGSGNFESQHVITSEADGVNSLYLADLDDDGDIDVLSGSDSALEPGIEWYENVGSGEFSSGQTIEDLAISYSVRASDLDADGDLDVLSGIGQGLDRYIVWYENDGSGNFSDRKLISENRVKAYSVHAVDLTGDGALDVLSASNPRDSLQKEKVAWFENSGGGEFSSRQVVASFDSAGAFKRDLETYPSDLDGDGDQDIIYALSSDQGNVFWFENNGEGSFAGEQVIADSITAYTVHAENLDSDSDDDVLFTSPVSIQWSENQSSGGFGEPKPVTTEFGPFMSYATDLDTDGDKDVLATFITGAGLVWYENEGSAEVAPPSGLMATAANGQVELTWSSGGGSSPAGYNVYRSTSSFSDPSNATKLNSSLLSDPDYTDTELTNGTTYFYRVTAVDEDGNESDLSEEVSATPTTLEDQVWATVEDEEQTFEFHVVSEEPIDDLQSRALSRETDQENLRHIYVTDGDGNAVSGETAKQLLFEVQSARKAAESTQIETTLQDFGIQASDRVELVRNEEDPTSQSYTARVPAATSDIFRRLFIFQPNIDFGVLVPGIDAPSNRRDLYAEVLFDAVLRPDIAEQFHGSLTDRLNQIGSAAGLTADALQTLEVIRNGGTVSKDQLQTTLDNFQSVTTNLKAAKYLGKAYEALSAASFSAELKDDAAEYYLLQSLTTAEAAARLDALERWFIAENPSDPALQEALGDVRDRFQEYLSNEQDGWLSNLTGAMENVASVENVIELGKVTAEVQNALGNLSPALQSAIKPWALSWTVGKKIREQSFAGARATVAATVWPSMIDRVQTIRSEVDGGTIDRADAQDLVHLANVSTYLSWYFYDQYIRISNNSITNFGQVVGEVVGLTEWSNYDQFVEHLKTRRKKSETMFGRTAPPHFFASRSDLTGEADREFSFLLNLLRNEKPDLSDPPPLVADFSVSQQIGPVPLEVEFINSSAGEIDSWTWRFGDGTTHQGPSPPVKTYEDGTYTITLTVSNEEGAQDREQAFVTAHAPDVNAEVGGTTISSNTASNGAKATQQSGVTVDFQNASEGSDLSYEWKFGDGTSSTEASPTHTYNHAGTYTVSLYAYGTGGQDVSVSSSLVEVGGSTGDLTVETNTTESRYVAEGPAVYLGGGSTSQTFEGVPTGEYTTTFAGSEELKAPPPQTEQVGPDEEAKVTGTYQMLPSIPKSFTAAPEAIASEDVSRVELDWASSEDEDLSSYVLFRGTSAGFDTTGARLTTVDSEATSYTDASVEIGQTYYYRVAAQDTSGVTSRPSRQQEAFLYSEDVPVAVTRSFGDASGEKDYRLVALPGEADQPLNQAVSGEPGTEWQAFWDDGSSEDYLQRFDGSSTFTFRPGKGFWLTSTQDWTIDRAVPSVQLKNGSEFAIAVHDGWNIIANPLDEGVAWSEVNSANSDSLLAIWRFEGSFAQADTFQSAKEGEAFYFLNDTGLDSLRVPYPGAPGSKRQAKSKEEGSLLQITAQRKGAEAPTSTVMVGFDEDAAKGLDRLDQPAPPGQFSALSLRLKAPGETPQRRKFLMTERRPPSEGSEEGQTFQLHLRSEADGPVRVRAKGLDAVGSSNAVLIRPATGRSYDLSAEGAITLEEADSTMLRLAVGNPSYVQDQAEKVAPEEVTLTSYPNPMHRQATLEYTLTKPTDVQITVYDVLGRRVAVLERGRKEAGLHRVRMEGDRLPSGIYFGRLKAGDQTRTQKITVVR